MNVSGTGRPQIRELSDHPKQNTNGVTNGNPTVLHTKPGSKSLLEKSNSTIKNLQASLSKIKNHLASLPGLKSLRFSAFSTNIKEAPPTPIKLTVSEPIYKSALPSNQEILDGLINKLSQPEKWLINTTTTVFDLAKTLTNGLNILEKKSVTTLSDMLTCEQLLGKDFLPSIVKLNPSEEKFIGKILNQITEDLNKAYPPE